MTKQEVLLFETISYLRRNPERFTGEEKNQFLLKLDNFIYRPGETIDDEIYDFLTDCEIIKGEKRDSIY